MAIEKFPPLDQADENGLLALGGDLEVPSLLLAYSQGIFPWPISPRYPLAWFSPDPRGILEYKNLHLSKSLSKLLRQEKFQVTFNQDFPQVIVKCAQVPRHKVSPKKAQDPLAHETWITEAIINAYIDLHYCGHAFSVEVWDQDQNLAAGLYGVCLGHYVCGESMFHVVDNASKVALATLMQHLHSKGIEWLDTQMVTPVVGAMGGQEIARQEFLSKLKTSLKAAADCNIFSLFESL